MNRRRADTLIAAVLADIAVFATIAEDDHRLALQGRFHGRLDAQQGGVVKRSLAAIGQIVNRLVEPLPVGRVIEDQARVVAECDDSDRVIGTERLQIAARGRLRLRQRSISHAAAGINHQYAGEIEIVIGDVLYAGDLRPFRQIAADGEVLDIQAGNQLFARVEDAGVDRHLR